MGRTAATVIGLAVLASTAVAQDRVLLNDGSTVNGKVLTLTSRNLDILSPGGEGKSRSIRAEDVQEVRLGDPPLSLLKAEVAAATGKYDVAIQHYSKALEEMQQEKDKRRHTEFVLYGWAKALASKGSTTEAVGKYRWLRYECGDCWLRSQSYLESIELLLPSGEEAVDTLAVEMAQDPLGISGRIETRLLGLLASPSFEDQGKGAKLIEALGKHGMAILDSGAKNENAQVRDWVTTLRPRAEERERKRKALADSRRKEAIQKFVTMLESDDFAVQGKAADALRKGGQAALPFVDELLEAAPRDGIRKWVAKIRESIAGDVKQLEETHSHFLQEVARLKASMPIPPRVPVKSTKELEAWAEEIKAKYPAFDDGFAALYAHIKMAADMEREASKVGRVNEEGRFRSRFVDRADALVRGGGTDQTEAAVLAALKWLAHHQNADGSWGADSFSGRCSGAVCSGKGERDYDTGVTGLSLLAFLGAGYTQLSQEEYPDPCEAGKSLRFGEIVKRGLGWLTNHQDSEGCIGERGMKYMYNHAIAACALVEAYGITGADALKKPAAKAVEFLILAQNPGKGWRYSAKCGDNDTSVVGWCAFALKAAEMADISFPLSAKEGILNWINEATEMNTGRTGYNARSTGKVYVPGKNENFDHHESMSAVAATARASLVKRKTVASDAAMTNACALLAKDLPRRRANSVDYYYWYYGSLCLYSVEGPSGPTWKAWNEELKGVLLKNQNPATEGCKSGSWEAVDRWSQEGGRVYGTALNALSLEVYYRYLSSSSR